MEQHVWYGPCGLHSVIFAQGITIWSYPPNQSVALHHLGQPANDEPDPLNLIDPTVDVMEVLDRQAVDEWNHWKFESQAEYEWV